MLTEERLVSHISASFWRGELIGEVVTLKEIVTQLNVKSMVLFYEVLEMKVLLIEKTMLDTNPYMPPSKRVRNMLAFGLEEFKQYSDAIHLLRLNKEYDAFKTSVDTESDIIVVSDKLKELRSIFLRELENIPCYFLSRDFSKYLTAEVIPKIVREYFAECVIDLEQANKSLAFGLDAACVYHCTCILQPILQKLSTDVKELGGDNDPGTTAWQQLGVIIGKLDTEITALSKGSKNSQVRAKLKTLSELNNHARTVKWAWRDDNAHGRNQYSTGVAKDILDNITKFVTYLAEIEKAKQSAL